MTQHWKLVALVWVPFVSIFGFAAPALVDRVGDSYPHVVFHLLASMLLVVAARIAWRLHAAAPTRTQRLLLRVLVVTVPAAALGNVLEMVAALGRLAADGWRSEPTPDLFGPEGGLHFVASNLTIPALMVSMLASLALASAVAWQGMRRGGRAFDEQPSGQPTQADLS